MPKVRGMRSAFGQRKDIATDLLPKRRQKVDIGLLLGFDRILGFCSGLQRRRKFWVVERLQCVCQVIQTFLDSLRILQQLTDSFRDPVCSAFSQPKFNISIGIELLGTRPNCSLKNKK